ncbi:hypothetical protein LC613_10620 [Nostoc sphaeroides CHAB 2801]|uniref:Uncharacterized protein n=1 Tax=Nostoc sphaeroides CCNUC1 TaxID=2653204 RepID=A0A5P8VTX0_9NOSO|nr:hypothetical protein [Nostoc sphaeroides]MCC5628530.1 hypothetical protein [Nostoc sphaeroides CHAB 2801]QFS43830.1 hypothetical protein GXM_01303 [Nostoc sphaeroides CCNUC1]
MPSLDLAAASGVRVSANAILSRDNEFLWAGWTHGQTKTWSHPCLNLAILVLRPLSHPW